MPLGTIYNDLINEIITQLKTIPELSNSTFKWKSGLTAIPGKIEAFVLAGPMEPREGFTTKSSNNEFQVIVDLLQYSSDYDTGFTAAMGVAQKIYDKFHLTNINNLVRIAKVSLYPGDGQLTQRNLLAIPIRIVIRCEKVITQ